jgi:type 2 lantibiotic biosynthesis protein LanM
MLLRDSRRYAVLLHTLAQPKYQQSGARRGVLIEALNRAHCQESLRPKLWPLVADERAALENMDVPRFTVSTSEAAIVAANGERIERFFDRSGFDAVTARLARLDEDDLARQASLLRSALANSPDAVLVSPPPEVSSSSAPGAMSNDLEAAALWVGRELLGRATTSRGALLWSYREHADPAVAGSPADLYDGAAGVSLFFAALAHVTGDRDWADAARRAAVPLEEALDGAAASAPAALGAGHGLGSWLWGASWIARLVDDPSLAERARAAVQRLPESAVREGRSLDVMSGTAGTILALLTLHRHTREPRALDLARACGEHLLEQRVVARHAAVAWPAPDRRLLAGFAHGTAGISYALGMLHRETGERSFLDAAAGGHRYERQLWSPAHHNWPIIEGEAGGGEQSIFAWCHGAPGIGLARAAGIDALDDGDVRDEIRAGATAAANPHLTRSDHLCCGNLGRADVLLTIGLRIGSEDLVVRSRALCHAVARRAVEARRFGLPSTPYSQPVFIPGFFRGLAGIGYQLLRTVHPSRLPSVLAFEPATGDRRA